MSVIPKPNNVLCVAMGLLQKLNTILEMCVDDDDDAFTLCSLFPMNVIIRAVQLDQLLKKNF